jgi:hypothetical protein
MNNQEMIGMFSAYTAAKEMPYGSNMTISAALVVEMVERIVELEKENAELKNNQLMLYGLTLV